jgi:hypothetical protein
VPLSDTTAGEFDALLTKETLPENGPLVSGANTILTLRVAPAAIVTGRERLVENTPPVKFAAETLTELLPVFDRVTVWLAVLPTRTLPKFTLVGDALSNCVGGAVAVPDKLTTGGVLGALLTTVNDPVKLPVVVGAKRTVSVAELPAATVNGNVAPTRLNPVPVTAALLTEKLVPPVFETVRFCVEVVFWTMLPNAIKADERAICAGAGVTVTVTEANFVLSATLVARTV